MEDGTARLRNLVKEELETLLVEMERCEVEAGRVPSSHGLLTGGFRRCLEVAGAVLVGVLCGILSHVGVILFLRALQ